jgi:type II secretory pathway pseudopilin PulG
MLKKKTTRQKGITLVELMIAATCLGIVVLAVGVALAEGQWGWNKMYRRVYSDVVTEGEAARRTFDSVVRKSHGDYIWLDYDGGTWIELRYYDSVDSSSLDRYARFYTSGNELKIEYGSIDDAENKIELLTQTLCSNVSSCAFIPVQGSIQMILMLDNGSETTTVVSSAIAQN